MDIAYVIKSNVTGLYLKANFGEVNYKDGHTNKISRAIVFDNKEDLKKFWVDRLLTDELFEVQEL